MLGRRYAAYHARDWAEWRSVAEIQAEIAQCEKPRTYQWNEVGSADNTYHRIETLKLVLRERLNDWTNRKSRAVLRERLNS